MVAPVGRKTRLRGTAVHEVGHAIIGRVLGMTCGHVTIEADHNSAGHSITADPYAIQGHWEERGKFRNMTSVFHGRILTLMAGAEAETEIIGKCTGGRDGDDRYQIALMLEHAQREDDAFEQRLRRMARMLVRRHRPLIERLARDLMKAGKLSADQADAIMPKGSVMLHRPITHGPSQHRISGPVIKLFRGT